MAMAPRFNRWLSVVASNKRSVFPKNAKIIILGFLIFNNCTMTFFINDFFTWINIVVASNKYSNSPKNAKLQNWSMIFFYHHDLKIGQGLTKVSMEGLTQHLLNRLGGHSLIVGTIRELEGENKRIVVK